MISADYVVVGSGLTGSVVARLLADAGRDVVILERRERVGGNVADATHEPSGIRFSLYGPHYFRTSCPRIWEFATRFGAFHPYEARVLSSIDGELVPWPPQRWWIEKVAGKDWNLAFTGTPRNFEEACLSMMPKEAYFRAVKPYSEKQWGRPCTELSAALCKRFDIRDGDDRLTPNAKWQGIPRDGYSAWMANMLAGIDVRTGFDYLRRRDEVQARRQLVFTGPLDEYFDFRLGRLEYRAQERDHAWYTNREQMQPIAQVNNPQHERGRHIRTIEWKHLMPPGATANGTLVTRELPYTPTDPDAYEYPFPDEANDRLRAAYRELARVEERVTFAGRLGKGVYADMDQSIGAALKLAADFLTA